jgi:aminoglycoside 6'-N-acetyltransferase
MVPSLYTFRPMSAADLTLIQHWLTASHVARWWGNPNDQYALVSGDLDDPAMDQFIVSIDDRPFAYLQCYDPQAWPDNGFGPQPAGTRGIDQFIGEAGMLGRGHGAALIRDFVDALLETGAPRVITDPDPANACAVKAYERAGLRKERLVATPDGRALLMVRNA